MNKRKLVGYFRSNFCTKAVLRLDYCNILFLFSFVEYANIIFLKKLSTVKKSRISLYKLSGNEGHFSLILYRIAHVALLYFTVRVVKFT